MLQNSLDRLLEGMAASLHEVVLPALDDPFARSQVTAVIELLGNLSTRVEWRCADLAALVDRVREVLVEVAGAAGGDDPALDPVRAVLAQPAPAGAPELAAAATAHLAALGLAQEWAAARPDRTDLDGRLREVVRWHLDGELARLRSASYGRPA